MIKFSAEEFSRDLASRLEFELDIVRPKLRFDTLRALALDCYPWYGYLAPCILTDREEYSEDELGKWAMGEWRFFEFTSNPEHRWPYARDLMQTMVEFYESASESKNEAEQAAAADILYRACADALNLPNIMERLREGFNLSTDFELGVFDPKAPERGNFCYGVV